MTSDVPSISGVAGATWDGLPAAIEAPYGAVIVVYRNHRRNHEFLLLHRAHQGAQYEGDWAWTPPSGCRFPDESIEACAARELMEEAGLELPLKLIGEQPNGWTLFVAKAPYGAAVDLIDREHDRCEWLSVESALLRCEPNEVKQELQAVVAWLAQ